MTWINRTKIYNQLNMYVPEEANINFDDNVQFDLDYDATHVLIASNQGGDVRFTFDGTTPAANVGFLIEIGGTDKVDTPTLFPITGQLRIFQTSGSAIQPFRVIKGYQ